MQAEDNTLYIGQRKTFVLRLRDALDDPWDCTGKQVYVKVGGTMASTGTKFLSTAASGDPLIGKRVFTFDDADSILLSEGALSLDIYLGTGFHPTIPNVVTGRSLTGTVAFVNGNSAVVGTGTAFLTELQIGQKIKLVSDAVAFYATVLTITDNTNLTFAAVYAGTTSTAAATVEVVVEQVWVTQGINVIAPYNGAIT